MKTESPVLVVENLVKRFRIGFFRRRVVAVDGVSFDVKRGEIFGLLGPNGAGKTTTLKTLMGLIHPTEGTLRLFGEPVTKPAVRQRVGYLPENPYFHEYLTPRELLMFHGRLAGMSNAEISKRRDELIDYVGLGAAANRALRKFSKGMLQRIGLAQALLAKPDLLILDEPMSGLDPVGRKFVTDLMKTLNNDGTTILFSSHILSDVERLCDRVVILKKGKKALEGAIEDLLKHSGKAETFEELFIRKAFETPPENGSESDG
jgi:ABC-2 type transport system ATP-binding protein